MYSTNSDKKVVFVEQSNRTLLNLIEEPMYIVKPCWRNHLDAVIEKNNIRVHSTSKFEMVTNKLMPNNNIKFIKNKKITQFPSWILCRSS